MSATIPESTRSLAPERIAECRSFLQVSYDEHRRRHGTLLKQITEVVPRSPVYAGRIQHVDSLDALSSLPLTPYERIARVTEEQGPARALLAPYASYWETSGYTGRPKRMYYSADDIKRTERAIGIAAILIGVRPWHTGWSFGAAYPLLSGSIVDMIAGFCGITDYVSTPVNNERDFVKAMRRISRCATVDIMAGPPLLYQMITRMAHDMDFYRRLAAEKAHRDYRLPNWAARPAARLYLAGIDPSRLRHLVANAKMAVSFGEPMQHYVDELRRSYPQVEFHDFLGSTEALIYGVQWVDGDDWLSLLLQCVIPELADPAEVLAAREDPGATVAGIPWYQWEAGIRGELILTRPGDCLPLLRYPTGDLVEVVDPAYQVEKDLEGERISFALPAIRMLGRAVDAFDFEVPDEMGIFPIGKIYSRDVHDAMDRAGNVRWWELHYLRGSPGRLVLLVIPEGEPSDKTGFGETLRRCLQNSSPLLANAIGTAQVLGAFELIVTAPEAYTAVQAEIERRVREKRNLGQMKPRHIYFSDAQKEMDALLRPKLQTAIAPSTNAPT
jgi:phenylacetate-coenzyme A ligase PaaK-like adenylate-forming protein